MPQYKDMESGQNYLVETKETGFYNGFYGTLKRVEDKDIVLENAVKLNVSSLAFGIDRGKSLDGEVRISFNKVKFVSAPIVREE